MHTLVLLVVKNWTYAHVPVTHGYIKSQIMTLIAVNSGRVIALSHMCRRTTVEHQVVSECDS